MMGLGVSELLMLFAIFGGMADGTPVKLNAPSDDATKVVRYVLPDADVVVHTNFEAAVGNVFGMLDELEKLGLVQAGEELKQGLGKARQTLNMAFEGAQQEAHIDLRKDLGSVTLSLQLNSPEELRILVRVKGNFKSEEFRKLVVKDLEAPVPVGKHSLYALKNAGVFLDMAMVMPDNETLIIGHRPAVMEILGKGKLAAEAKSNQAMLKTLVKRGTLSYMYLSLPDWLATELSKVEELAAVSGYVQGLDYLFVSSGRRKGLVVVQANDEASARLASYQMKAAVALMGTLDELIDVVVYGVLGLVPLVPQIEEEIGPELTRLLGDEKGLLELGNWLKKRFTGKSRVKLDTKRKMVRLEMDNPSSAAGMMLPVMVGAGAYFVLGKKEPEMPLPPAEPPRQPLIYHLPQGL